MDQRFLIILLLNFGMLCAKLVFRTERKSALFSHYRPTSIIRQTEENLYNSPITQFVLICLNSQNTGAL